jgi:hypothetical protein
LGSRARVGGARGGSRFDLFAVGRHRFGGDGRVIAGQIGLGGEALGGLGGQDVATGRPFAPRHGEVNDLGEGLDLDGVDLPGVVLLRHVPHGVREHLAEPGPAHLVVVEEASKLVFGHGTVAIAIERTEALRQLFSWYDAALTEAPTELHWEIEPSH